MNKTTGNHNCKIYSLSFNQNFTLFSFGTENGFKIFNTSKVNQNYEKNLSGGIRKCELSYQSNYLALVGGGKTPYYNNNKVVIYNDAEELIESEYKFTTPVLNVKIKKDLLFIICEKKIYVFNVQNSQNIDSFDTVNNIKGLIAINGNPENTILAYPIEFGRENNKGYVSIKNYNSNEKGTLIRIHSCKDGTLMQECYRGKEKAEIIYISFDINYKYIGVSSDRKTIHIWKLDNIIERKKKERNLNFSKSFNFKDSQNFKMQLESHLNNKNPSFKNLVEIEDISREEICLKEIKNYKNESSFAKIRMSEPYCIFCFRPKDIVNIISYTGKYSEAQIDSKKGGDCVIRKTININDDKKEKQ